MNVWCVLHRRPCMVSGSWLRGGKRARRWECERVIASMREGEGRRDDKDCVCVSERERESK